MGTASTIAKIATPIILPFIMQAVGKRMAGSPTNRPVVDLSSLIGAPMPPAIINTPTLPGQLGSGLDAVGRIGATVVPFGLDILGRGIQAGGIAAGSVLAGAGQAAQALGTIPLAFSSNSDAKRALYGLSPAERLATLTSAVGSATNALGTAAGTGVSAVGNAVGSSLQHMGNAIRLWQLQQALLGNFGNVARGIKHLNMSPTENQLAATMISNLNRVTGIK